MFDSTNFLLFFLVVYFYYRLFRNSTWKKVILIIASYLFYAFWNFHYAVLLLASTLFSYYLGMSILKNKSRKKTILVVGIACFLLYLGVFKYWNFIASNLNELNSNIPYLSYLLPIGISFYVFHIISYLIDCYNSRINRLPKLIDYVLYLSFFPKLISGPITKSYDLLGQIRSKIVITKSVVWKAIVLIFFGLFKKLVFANNLSPFVDNIFSGYASQGGLTLVVGAYAYAIQIYCDFSGYTDIAIGLAMFFGFLLPNNFNYPYLATSPSDFWKRWHITLSTWFKEYVYFPLGGSRRGSLITYRNIFLVMLLTGIWHGASWNYILWGLYLAVLSVLYKYFGFIEKYLKKVPDTLRGILAILAMLQFTIAGWIIFRSKNLAMIKGIFSKIFRETDIADFGLIYQHNQFVIVLMLIFIAYNILRLKFEIKARALANQYNPLVMTMILVGLMVILIAYPTESVQFIYFKF